MACRQELAVVLVVVIMKYVNSVLLPVSPEATVVRLLNWGQATSTTAPRPRRNSYPGNTVTDGEMGLINDSVSTLV